MLFGEQESARTTKEIRHAHQNAVLSDMEGVRASNVLHCALQKLVGGTLMM